MGHTLGSPAPRPVYFPLIGIPQIFIFILTFSKRLIRKTFIIEINQDLRSTAIYGTKICNFQDIDTTISAIT